MNSKKIEICFIHLLCISASIAEVLMIQGLSPSLNAVYGSSAGHSDDGMVLAMGYSNSTILVYRNNGTQYLFSQQILNVPFSDMVYVSGSGDWMFFSSLNILSAYKQVNGIFILQSTHQCSWAYSSAADTMRFAYSDHTNTIFAFSQLKNVVEVISTSNGSLVLTQTINIINGYVLTIKVQKRRIFGWSAIDLCCYSTKRGPVDLTNKFHPFLLALQCMTKFFRRTGFIQ